MEFIKTTNLPEQIANMLADKIIRLDLKPGERIYEAKMARDLGVSQSPIREALRILEKNGLVEIIPRRGTAVSVLTRTYIEWLYDILTEIYGLLARKTLENFTGEHLALILDAIHNIEVSADNDDAEGYYNGIFAYAAVALKIVDSRLLEKVIMDLWPNKRRIEFITISYRKLVLRDNLKYFQLLRGYITERNTEMVEKTTRDYIQNEKRIAIEVIIGP
jgi:DNA-binding GntR family transcriptional regulator